MRLRIDGCSGILDRGNKGAEPKMTSPKMVEDGNTSRDSRSLPW